MRADYRVVLDACVLIPMPLADTLLRMAEAPRLYLPKWSRTIMGEVTQNLIGKWRMAPEKAHRREEELRRHDERSRRPTCPGRGCPLPL